MKYSLEKSIQVLERTPVVLKSILSGLDDEWIISNEGPGTFSPYDVIGHLIHGEKTDWIVRTKIILESGASTPFPVFDRFAQFEASKGKTIAQLLNEFETLRKKNLEKLNSLQLTDKDFDKTGMHPSLGEVTLKNLLATWVVHDLTHIAQVTRAMAKQFKEEMGPWPEFFRILNF